MLEPIENEQLGVGAACWVTVNARPPMLRLPVRPAPALAATVNVTVPGPLPLAGDGEVIQDAWLVAVHAHPPEVETAIAAPAPPALPMD